MSTADRSPDADAIGAVTGIALRTAKQGVMREVPEALAHLGAGLEGDHGQRQKRGVTLLAAKQWREVLDDLGADLPWHTRRANVLIDCGSMADLIGRTITIGEARLRIHNQTAPCDRMDELHPGLQEALRNDCRGGIYGEVVEAGRVRIGDRVTLLA